MSKKTLSRQELLALSPEEYLEATIFPVLLPALEKLLHLHQQRQSRSPTPANMQPASSGTGIPSSSAQPRTRSQTQSQGIPASVFVDELHWLATYLYQNDPQAAELRESRKQAKQDPEQAACSIQSAFRGHVGRKQARSEKERKKRYVEEKSAVKIQSVYRGHLVRKGVDQERQLLAGGLTS